MPKTRSSASIHSPVMRFRSHAKTEFTSCPGFASWSVVNSKRISSTVSWLTSLQSRKHHQLPSHQSLRQKLFRKKRSFCRQCAGMQQLNWQHSLKYATWWRSRSESTAKSQRSQQSKVARISTFSTSPTGLNSLRTYHWSSCRIRTSTWTLCTQRKHL